MEAAAILVLFLLGGLIMALPVTVFVLLIGIFRRVRARRLK
jgi:F0F1-type ATP synthase assembly protein I